MSFFSYEINELVLREAVSKYWGGDVSTQLISTSMNGIYSVQNQERDYILRFSHPLKDENQIRGEIEFIQYLYSRGANVAKPLVSKDKSFVETVGCHQKFNVCAFEKAVGSTVSVNDTSIWNDKLFYNWGKTIGKMHRLTKGYVPTKVEFKRNEWNEESISIENSIFSPELVVSDINQVVLGKWKKLLNEVNSLPKDKDSYGLVHSDLHMLNFVVNEGRITVFDFDDCCYNWFSYDIAIAFYDSLYGIPFVQRKNRKEFLKHFSSCFFNGYSSENTLSDYWIKKIPFFINYRDYLMYMVTIAHLDIEHMSIEERQLYDNIRINLERDVPYVDFNPA